MGWYPDTSGSALFQAVKGLGLELKSPKDFVETIIVDHMEKTPTANWLPNLDALFELLPAHNSTVNVFFDAQSDTPG